jgi:hypothetical protein
MPFEVIVIWRHSPEHSGYCDMHCRPEVDWAVTIFKWLKLSDPVRLQRNWEVDKNPFAKTMAAVTWRGQTDFLKDAYLD